MGDALEELYDKYNILSEAKANIAEVSVYSFIWIWLSLISLFYSIQRTTYTA